MMQVGKAGAGLPAKPSDTCLSVHIFKNGVGGAVSRRT